MSRPWHLLLVVAIGFASAIGCFVAGVYFQHNHATRLLQQLVQQDPYAYYISPKIFGVVSQQSAPFQLKAITNLFLSSASSARRLSPHTACNVS